MATRQRLALALAFPLTLLAHEAAAQSVLVLDDTTDLFEAAEAATALGWESATTRNVAGFIQQFDSGAQWDVLVVDIARLLLTPDVVSRVDSHIRAGGNAIVAYADLETSPALATALGLRCTGELAYRPMFPANSAGIDVFGYSTTFASPLLGTSRFSDSGDICALTSGGRVLATTAVDGGDPAVILTAGDRVIFNAIALDSFRTTNADGDTLPDGVELVMNELVVLDDLRPPAVHVWGPTESAAIAAWAGAYDGESRQIRNAVDASNAVARREPLAFWIELASPADVTADLVTATATMRDALVPIVVFAADAATLAAAAALTGDRTGVEGASDTLLLPTDSLRSLAFSRIDGTIDLGIDGDFVSPVVLAPSAGDEVLLDWANGGAALLGEPTSALILGGFAPSTLDGGDNDLDGYADAAELVANILASTRLLDAPLGFALTGDARATEIPVIGAMLDRGAMPLRLFGVDEFGDALGVQLPVFAAIDTAGAASATTTELAALAAQLAALEVPFVAALSDGPSLEALGSPWAIAVSLSTTTSVEIDTFHLGQIYFGLVGMPQSLARAAAANVATFDRPGRGSVVATATAGAPIIVVAGAYEAVLNGFDAVDFSADVDVDRHADSREWLARQLEVLQTPPTAELEGSGADAALIVDALLRVGLKPAAVGQAGDAPVIVVFASEGSGASLDAQLAPRVAATVDGTPTLYVVPSLHSAPAAATTLAPGATSTLARAVVESRGDPTRTFSLPLAIPSPLALADSSAPATALGESVEVGARFGTNAGPAAAAFSVEGRAAVLGISPTALDGSDVDDDGTADRVEWVANLLVRIARVPRIVLSTPASADEGSSVALDANGSRDPSGESLTLTWDLDGDGAFDDATGVTTSLNLTTFDGRPGASITIGVRAVNTSGIATAIRRTIAIDNVRPTITLPTEVVVGQGEAFDVTAIVDDVDPDVLVVSWNVGDGLPLIVGERAQWEYAEPGSRIVEVTVSDDDGASKSGTFRATMTDDPPVIEIGTYAPIDEGSTQEFRATASDPGDDLFAIEWDFGDGSDPAYGAIASHLYADNGEFVVTGTALQAGAPTLSTIDSFRLTVRNVAPTITSTPATGALDTEQYTYDVVATDPGADPLTYRVVTGPASLTVDAAGRVSWQPGLEGYGDYTVSIEVLDGDGGRATQTWTVSIEFADADSGGAPDECELRWELNPDDAADDTADPDGDGISTVDECLSGRNPVVFSGPPAPELLSPVGGETWTRSVVTLRFGNVVDPDGDAVSYEAELYADAALTSLVASFDAATGGPDGETAILATAEFIEDVRYFWRARALASDADGVWSEPADLLYNLENSSPDAVVLIAPVDVSSSAMPELRVENTTDPDGDLLWYDFQLFEGESTDASDRLFDASGIAADRDGETTTMVDVELEEGALYTWRARAVDAARPVRTGTWTSATFVVDAANVPPGTPVVVRPIVDNALDAATRVTLVWSNPTDADGDALTYFGALSRDEAFTQIEAEFSGVVQAEGDTTSTIVAHPIRASTEYWWRVAADDGREPGQFAIAHFTTRSANTAPSVPAVVSPAIGEVFTIPPDTLVFEFEPASDPDALQLVTYDVEISNTLSMEEVVWFAVNVEGSGESITVDSDFDRDGTWFWHVRSFDGFEYSGWSDARGFDIRAGRPADDVGVIDAGDAGGDAGNGSGDDAGGGPGDGGGCATAPRSSAPLFGLLLIALAATRRRRSP